ncbi:MAG: NERD domain-containing protein [Anaerolineae bacterium]|nr:NERD domain-containing protein [Anaerolineae bacterium]
MARMIPAQIYRGTPSRGEREIFCRLADDPNTRDWIVLHSLDISHHERRLSGEIDFVTLVPHKGVLCLEVKATSSIKREQGLWYYGQNPIPDQRGPFKQSAQAMHSIRQRLKKIENLANIPFWSAVAFPYLRFSISSDEWHAWQVIDSDDLRRRPMSILILGILDQARDFLTENNARWFDGRRNEPTIDQCEQIAHLLRPDFEIFEPPNDKMKRLELETKIFTEEQFSALDAMTTNPRVIFRGPAGTGKTTLAIEAARRSRALGNRVLFVCYNRLLGSHLKSETVAIQPEVRVSTIHRHMLDVAGIHPHGESIPQQFWRDDLPQQAIDSLLARTDEEFSFDEVIVDEAQDLLRNSYLDFIDLSLTGGLSSGKWKLFGDFEKQAIYGSNVELSLEEAMNSRFPHVPVYNMRVNCRNTPRIATLAQLLSGLDPEYSRILRPDNGVEPNIAYYSDPHDQRVNLLRVIQELKEQGYSNGDIVVLSTKAVDKSIVQSINAGQSSQFANLEETCKGRIRTGSVHAYKGLESPAVIVTDVDILAGDMAASVFYVAITRALHHLYILADSRVRHEVLRIALSQKDEAND